MNKFLQLIFFCFLILSCANADNDKIKANDKKIIKKSVPEIAKQVTCGIPNSNKVQIY